MRSIECFVLTTHVLCYNDTQIKQVCSFKLLGIVIDRNLKWSSHVDEICTKASRRLHFLKVLKRSAVSVDDLYYFYVSAIRPVLEYACPVWHTSLTKEQTKQLESVQKRALRIIYNSNCLDYEKAKANNAGIKTTAFSTRRVFFQKKCSTK